MMSKQIEISMELLSDLYKNQKLSTFQIAEKLGCCQATIWKKLKKFNVEARLPGVKRVNISKQKLKELYISKKFSTWKIEKITKIPRGTIHRKLREFGIKIRDRATSHIIYFRKDFSGDLLEKAYLIGFRLGDLGVRKIYPNSKTISVASGSTIKNQIDLIKSLFENYGKVWIQKTKDNKINIQINLNESFNFLLDKEVPCWVKDSRKCFFAFLAGFTDAEGSIKIYNKMASYSLGNYNYKLLDLIKNNLMKYGVNCNSLVVDKRKGKKNSEGYIYRNNYCSLRINSKIELPKLFPELKKYMKHKDKVKDLNIAISNINQRIKT